MIATDTLQLVKATLTLAVDVSVRIPSGMSVKAIQDELKGKFMDTVECTTLHYRPESIVVQSSETHPQIAEENDVPICNLGTREELSAIIDEGFIKPAKLHIIDSMTPNS